MHKHASTFFAPVLLSVVRVLSHNRHGPFPGLDLYVSPGHSVQVVLVGLSRKYPAVQIQAELAILAVALFVVVLAGQDVHDESFPGDVLNVFAGHSVQVEVELLRKYPASQTHANDPSSAFVVVFEGHAAQELLPAVSL